MSFNPSPEQADFFSALREGKTNLCLSAVAGSGKTTTILEGLKVLPVTDPESFISPNVCFLAFNKSIADTLKARVPKHVACSTFHSLGMRALKTCAQVDPAWSRSRDWVNARKVPRFVWSLLDREDPDIQPIIRLVSLLKGQWPTAQELDVQETIRQHDLSFSDERGAVQVALEVLGKSDKKLDEIDFDDMLRLPLLLGARWDTQDWVFVDECQDLNSVQSEICWQLGKSPAASSGGDRTIFTFVGDPRQAIYGFRGASADSFEALVSRFSCRVMPLSVSFRCSKAVVAEAQKYFK